MQEHTRQVLKQDERPRNAGVKQLDQPHGSSEERRVTEAYGRILTRQLLIGEPGVSNFFKCY